MCIPKVKKTLLVMMSLTLLLMLFSSVAVMAQNPDVADQDAEDYTHQIPKLPVIVDGIIYSPQEITRFNGQPLIMIANEMVEKEGIIYAFTTEENAEKYTSSVKGILSIPKANPDYTVLYKDTTYNYAVDDARCGESWNLGNSSNYKVTSSVITAHCGYGTNTKLYDNFNLQGSSLWITTGYDISNLSVYGWNDRAASYYVQP